MGVTGTNFSKVYTAGAVSAEVPAVSAAASTKVSQEASTNTAEVVSTVPDVGLKEVSAAGAAINTEDIADAAGVTEKNEVEEATAADLKDDASESATSKSKVHSTGSVANNEDEAASTVLNTMFLLMLLKSSFQTIMMLALMLLKKTNLLLTRYVIWTPMAQNLSPKSMLMGLQLTKGSASGSVSIEDPSEVASQSEVMEINVGSLTALPDASNITSQCIAATELQADPDPDPDPDEDLNVPPDVPASVSAVPDATTLEAALQDVSCTPALIPLL